jgi:hypothetical protein
MTQEKFCQDCSQKHDCEEIYRKLGNIRGPSVVFNVVVAFLVPILVFILSLAAFEAILSKGALSFLPALAVTFVMMLIIKAINRRVSKNK